MLRYRASEDNLFRLDVRVCRRIFRVVPAEAGTHNPREKLGEDSSFGTATMRNG
jgi:hypothetical protein